ncbi:hypothetical protein HALLA_01140 (plasmid) [Halostagnicola larsenii XH-48]|uniref:Uncharacterized protein n=1 Tax=Halostagnicola larsenii XH-48 TaxID=797299 RepID=W0JTI4_9EURY|nr:hypothetical protein HALLA_01140 [Halostagnicola larsenii XH-48]
MTNEVGEFWFDDCVIRILTQTFISIFLAVGESEPETEQGIQETIASAA